MKRWDHEPGAKGGFIELPRGDYVLWEDVEPLVEALEKTVLATGRDDFYGLGERAARALEDSGLESPIPAGRHY